MHRNLLWKEPCCYCSGGSGDIQSDVLGIHAGQLESGCHHVGVVELMAIRPGQESREK